MRKTAAAIVTVLGLFMAQGIHANVLDLYGIVTGVNANPLIKGGDAVYITASYSPSTGSITRLTATINGSVLNIIRVSGNGNFVSVDENAADGTVQWTVTTSSGTSVDVATNTPGGVVPCIEGFDLGRSFQIVINNIIATGTITAKPKTRTGQ